MKTNRLFKNLIKYRNLAIALWLVSDILWVMNLHTAAIVTSVFMLLSAAHIAYQSRQKNIQLSYNVILCYWFAANTIWMWGEFSANSMLWLYAGILYFAGLTVAVANISFYSSKRKIKAAPKTKVMYRGIHINIDKAA